MSCPIACTSTGVVYPTWSREHVYNFHRPYAGAWHDALDVALWHQEQAIILEADHFGIQSRLTCKGNGARAAHGQLQAHGFHEESCNPGYAPRYLHGFRNLGEFAAVP
jgi:hypothetical protein